MQDLIQKLESSLNIKITSKLKIKMYRDYVNDLYSAYIIITTNGIKIKSGVTYRPDRQPTLLEVYINSFATEGWTIYGS